MTKEEINQFKENWKKIIYKNSELEKYTIFLKKLHYWDKNDSHKKHILKVLEKRDEIKLQLKELLKNKTIDEWREQSKKISILNQKYKKSLHGKDFIQKLIDELTF